MKKDSKYIWYLLDVGVFLAINIIILASAGDKLLFTLSNLNWTTITILALGVYRLTDVITQENVTEFIRVPFMIRSKSDHETWEYATEGLSGFFGILLSCNACMGVWVSMIITYLYVYWPVPIFIFMIIMTLTCFERFLSKIYNVLEKKG